MEPKPSATVVLLRDAAPGLELLLLQRAPRRDEPGPWVFPGGKVEPADVVANDAASRESGLRAAVRETREEAGLALDEGRLVPISRWITPEVSPQRFDTWFFLGAVDTSSEVLVCGSEIVGHRWLGATEALEAHDSREIQLAPPTFVTVSWLSEHRRAAEAIRALSSAPFITFRPRIHRTPECMVMLYPGDAGYDANDPARGGPRHRILALDTGWRYERS
jgi:8-oxo-dGTP pyrophosphatase MutT (NUDIX family)